jgi:sugar/nucleoside kinase (ribokinase family)
MDPLILRQSTPISDTVRKDKPVVCLGIMVADVVGRPLRSIPKPGKLVLVDEMDLYTGGCAINTATALAQLGLPAEVIGKIGDDPFGRFLLDTLIERGIGTRGVKRDPNIGTSATMVMVQPDGERCFVHFIGANAHLTEEDVDFEMIAGASILHVAGSLVMPGIDGRSIAELLKRAGANGVVTFLDTVWDDTGRWMKVLEPCLPHIDYFVPSLPEAQALTGLDNPTEVAYALLDHGVGTVALKMGDAGCLVISSNKQTEHSSAIVHIPAFQVNVVDATGAGDAFAAGFIAGVWQGWPLEQTARFANAVGALCVTGPGAAGGVRSLEQTIEFMENTPYRK